MSALSGPSALPLYVRLADRLLDRIRAGEYAAGERIPSEHALAAAFSVGRPTVRQATESLVRRGYLARRRGAGTFVRERAPHVDLFSLGGTLESFSRQGIALDATLVEPVARVRVPAEAEQPLAGREAFRLGRLTRLATVEGEPVLHERIWLDAAVFPGLDRADLSGRSLSSHVATHYRMEPQSAEQRFRACAATPELAARLGCTPGEPLLRVDRTLHFPTAPAAVFAEMTCRTDRIVFSQILGAQELRTPQPGDPHA